MDVAFIGSEAKRRANRAYYHRNREAILAGMKADTGAVQRAYARRKVRRQNPETWGREIIGSLRKRAQSKGLEFNLTPEDIVVPPLCPVFGVAFEFGSHGPNRPSVDRIDNSKGYVRGNVCVICARANQIKSDASISELESVIAYMRRDQLTGSL
jgi:hypothetical protein